MIASIPRFLLPLGHPYPPSRPLSVIKAPRIARNPLPTCRHASASAPKTIRLEKPTKFVPPSHGKRLKQQIPRHYGPQLTQTQKTEQATKKYPNMMPPPGTFMFWFLTTSGIHVFISMGTLVLLASFTAYENWKRDTAFRAQLPAASEFISHPIASCSQVFEIYKMDVARISAETAEKRKRNIEDVQKRTTYRRAHGLEAEDSQGMGGWTPPRDEETLGPSLKLDGPISRRTSNAVTDEPTESNITAIGSDTKESPYADSEGRKKPIKKWLGIW